MAAVTIFSGGGVASAGGSTTAAPASDRGSATVPGTTQFVFSSANSSRTLAPRRIICEMVFIGANHGAPHHSGHVPGTVNVRVRVTCTQPMRMIRGRVGLFSNHGSKINPYGSVGRAAARGNAALVCRPGYYQGESVAHLVAPPGYSPPSANMRARTARVHLTKC